MSKARNNAFNIERLDLTIRFFSREAIEMNKPEHTLVMLHRHEG